MIINRVIQFLSIGQIIAGLALGGAALTLRSACDNSVGDVVTSLIQVTLSACDAIETAANTVERQHEPLAGVQTALKAYRDVVKQLKATSQETIQLAPNYVASLNDMAKTVTEVESSIRGVADHLDFSIPSGLEWQGIKPQLTYSKPFDESARKLIEVAGRFNHLSETLSKTGVLVANQSNRGGTELIRACEQTDALLGTITESVGLFDSQELRVAAQNLHKTATTLRNTSGSLDNLRQIGSAAAVFGGIMSAAFVINGIIQLMRPVRPGGS